MESDAADLEDNKKLGGKTRSLGTQFLMKTRYRTRSDIFDFFGEGVGEV